ncbi:MAG: anaerobic sulfatase-maturation protein [Bacteroidaceae bacterium]|nr:anaerobic sulfatase-maturation protein [Bacteroidaceae bacterium]
MSTIAPFSKPLYVMLKPAGSLCNLACKYCYYLEKQKLYPLDKSKVISDALLEEFIKQYIEAQTMPQVLFTWHGGETLMRPISFYKHALELQKRYAYGRQIDNCIQTNGTMLTDEWCEFFKENNFLVGVSIDGPQEFHDEYRRTRSGKPSWHEVMKGIRLLQKHGVEWNALAVVNDFNADYPKEFYRFFKDLGCRYIQFTPVVERTVKRADGLTLAPGMQEGGEVTDFSVTPEQWGNFLCTLYDEWVKQDVGEIFIQLFDATLANWAGVPPGVCSMSGECGHAAVMEFNGDVYSCDHFVYPEYRLGNIRQQTLTGLMYSDRQRNFGKLKTGTLTRQCRECRFLFACHGECPKNRFVRDVYGNPGHNYLCAGYRKFFEHVAADMDFMKAELDAQRPPSNIMLKNR